MIRGAVCLIALFAAVAPVRAQEPLKIGVLTELTGNAATYGTDIKNAIIFANQELASGKYQLIFEDDKCSGKDAVAAAQKLVSIDKVKYVLGVGCSGSVLAAAPILEKAKVVLITPGTSAAKISTAGDYIFRTWPSDSMGVKILYDYLARKHRRIGILSEETEFCQGHVETLRAWNEHGPLEIVEQTFRPGEADLKPAIFKLLGANVEGIFASAQSEAEFAVLLRQLRQLKTTVPVYNMYSAGTPALLEMVKDEAEGVIFVDLPALDQVATAEGRAMFERFVAAFGKPVTWDLMWAAAVEAFRALHQGISSGKDVKSYLYEQQFNGVFGPWSFDGNGDIRGVVQVLKVVRGGKPELLQE